MKTAAIIGGVAIAGYFLLKKVTDMKNAAENLKVYITKPSGFKISGGMISLTVDVQIHNNSAAALPIQAILTTVDRKTDTGWVEFASSSPTLANLVIKPFARTVISVPMETSLMNLGLEIFSLITSGMKATYRVNVAPTVLGIRMPAVSSTFDF